MNYTQLVNSNLSKLDFWGKAALDLAFLLDHPLFQLDKKSWEINTVLAHKEKIFNHLCALFLKSQIPVPPLEPSFYEAHLVPDSYAKPTTHIEKHVQAQLESLKEEGNVSTEQSKEALLCAAYVQTLRRFPVRCDRRTLEAIINKTLISLGLQPLRPDYSKISLSSLTTTVEEGEDIKLLIYDDRKDEILKTAFALAGWPRIQILPVQYTGASTQKAAATILEHEADILLLDQLLHQVEGSNIVPILRESENCPIIVGNTGGRGAKFATLGIPNCNKGQNLKPVFLAVRQFSKSSRNANET